MTLFTVADHASISRSGITLSADKIQPRTRSLATPDYSAFNIFRGSFTAHHPAAVHRKGTRLTSAFATFFGVSDDSIRKDLTLIKRRLGKGWERRPDPLA